MQNERARDKLSGHRIDSVGQAVGDRSDKRCRQITLGVDTAACRTVVPGKASGNTKVQMSLDAEAGEVAWDEGRRLFVSKDTEGKPITIESRQAELRKPSNGCQTHDAARTMGLFRA